MKKFYMTIVAMLCGAAAMAQTNELAVEAITIQPGETVDVPILLNNESNVASFSFKLKDLPAGITVSDDPDEYSFNEDRIDVDKARELTGKPTWAAKKFYNFDVNQKETGTTITFAPTSAAAGKTIDGVWNGLAFLGNEGPIIYVPFTVAEGTTEQPYEITLSNVSISGSDAKIAPSIGTSDTATFTLTVGDGTGINTINAADSKAPVYNVAGQRVSKAQKGVFIQNGKKVAVK